MNKIAPVTATTTFPRKYTPWEYVVLIKNNRKTEEFQDVLENEISKLMGKGEKDVK